MNDSVYKQLTDLRLGLGPTDSHFDSIERGAIR